MEIVLEKRTIKTEKNSRWKFSPFLCKIATAGKIW